MQMHRCGCGRLLVGGTLGFTERAVKTLVNTACAAEGTGMKHVMYGPKPFLMDDETADLLLEYAGLLPREGEGDTVTPRAVSPDGNTVDMTLVLNANTELIAETTHSEITPPDNTEAAAYLRERLDLIRNPRPAQPAYIDDTTDYHG